MSHWRARSTEAEREQAALIFSIACAFSPALVVSLMLLGYFAYLRLIA